MTTQHTQGDWTIKEGHLIYGPDAEIANVRGAGLKIHPECDANAKLIAASPKLLVALEAAERAIEEATDIMHFEDAMPQIALSSEEIEQAYTALCSVMVQVEEAILAARVKP